MIQINRTYPENVLAYYPYKVIHTRVISVYDGDTFTAETLDGKFQFHVRIIGIDAPEMKSLLPTERVRAIIARNFLRNYILYKVVTLYVTKNLDPWRRVLAVVYDRNGQYDIGECMILNGHAIVYQGRLYGALTK
jgi:endonuclease YncB( thermonuclease family)